MGKRIFALTIVIVLLLGIPLVSQAAANSGGHKSVYIILVDKLSIYDISKSNMPAVNRLIKKASLGLASSRTLRSQSTIDTSLTIGSGNLARAYSHGLLGFNRDEIVPKREQTAAQLYHNLTGIDPQQNALLLVNMPELVAGMSKENVDTLPGAMSETLRKNQLKVCVLGNGDTGEDMLRSGIAVGMDARGQVPLGDVGPATYLSPPDSFLSYQTNYEYLAKQVEKYKNQADVTIIDLSDLARLESADTPLDAIGEKQKQLIFSKIDNFVDQIQQQIDPGLDLLLVIAQSPSQKQMMNKDSFTPIIAYGSNFNNGILSSAATRRDYVVANTDIAPTVLKFFGLKDETRTMIGQPIIASLAGNNRDTLQEAQYLSSRSSMSNRLRVPLIKGYVVLQIAVILLSLLAIFFIKRLVPIFEYFIVALVAIPLVLLPLGTISLSNDWLYMLAAVLLTVVLTILSLRIAKGHGFEAFVGLSILTVLVINIDLLTGATMIQSSVLGYDPMSGARYYGIGNEYMGILIGSMVAIAAALYERFNQQWTLIIMGLLFLLECYLIAGPLGANSDGMLTAPAAFLVTLALLSNIRIRPRVLLAFAGVILVIILGFTYFDMHRSLELQSHIGRAANQIAANGWQEGLTIINRKLGMNLKLIRYTIWSWVFIVSLLVLSLLVYRPIGAMGRLRKERPYLVKGFAGIITGAIIALIINDSGIVAASTTSIYLVMPLLLLILRLEDPVNPTLNRNSISKSS